MKLSERLRSVNRLFLTNDPALKRVSALDVNVLGEAEGD
jgi:hypothetical protein